jgi:hypothetical protein
LSEESEPVLPEPCYMFREGPSENTDETYARELIKCFKNNDIRSK